MASNAVKGWQARELWEAVKTAAQHDGELLDGLARVALTIWGEGPGGTKLASDRSHREAFVASLLGAATADTVIDKLAAEGVVSTPEAGYMHELNAEAAIRDLGQFQKTANVFRTVAQFIAQHPASVGSVAGAVAGGSFGAYADDDDRLRGALRYALPGAVMGGMVGHGVGQIRMDDARMIREEEEKLRQATREAELHAVKLRELRHKARGW